MLYLWAPWTVASQIWTRNGVGMSVRLVWLFLKNMIFHFQIFRFAHGGTGFRELQTACSKGQSRSFLWCRSNFLATLLCMPLMKLQWKLIIKLVTLFVCFVLRTIVVLQKAHIFVWRGVYPQVTNTIRETMWARKLNSSASESSLWVWAPWHLRIQLLNMQFGALETRCLHARNGKFESEK